MLPLATSSTAVPVVGAVGLTGADVRIRQHACGFRRCSRQRRRGQITSWSTPISLIWMKTHEGNVDAPFSGQPHRGLPRGSGAVPLRSEDAIPGEVPRRDHHQAAGGRSAVRSSPSHPRRLAQGAARKQGSGSSRVLGARVFQKPANELPAARSRRYPATQALRRDLRSVPPAHGADRRRASAGRRTSARTVRIRQHVAGPGDVRERVTVIVGLTPLPLLVVQRGR